MSIKRRRCFTIAEKMKIIERLESGVSNKDLCQELGISQSTLSTIWKSKDQLKSIFQKDMTSNKRLKCSQHQDVNQALLEWFKILSMALNNISNYVKKSYSNYKQTTIIDYFSNKS